MQHPLADWRAAPAGAAPVGDGELEKWRERFSGPAKAPSRSATQPLHPAQKARRGFLQKRIPDHDLLGEEDPAAVRGREGAPDVPTWIVDPLDGTANYVHDVPAYCVSVGLLLGGRAVAGAIYDPRQGEMFSAAAGLGATLNDTPISVSAVTEMRSALLSTGFPPDPECQERNLHWWRAFAYQAQALRRTGSTALN